MTATGCSSKKYVAVNTNGTVINKSNQDIVNDIIGAELKYETINAKASLELVPPNSNSGMKTNCYLKLIRDKELQLSVRIPLINSEAFRINVTPDSVYLIDRINKKYAIASIQKYQEQSNIDLNFYNLQALLTDALFMPGKKKLSSKDYQDYSITMASGLFHLETRDKVNTTYNFVVNSKDRVEAIMVYNKAYNFNLEWIYTNFVQDQNKYVYPTDIATKININNQNIKLNISYSSLDINTKVEIDRQMPNKYQQTSISNILKSYLK